MPRATVSPVAMTPPPDPLDKLLDRWSETPDPSPRLTASAWQHIALADQPARPMGWWAAVETWLARPAVAVGFVTACALLGLFLAELRVSHLQRERSAELARSYLRLIDPLMNAPAREDRS